MQRPEDGDEEQGGADVTPATRARTSVRAEALGLATVSIGAFADDRVRAVLGAPSSRRPPFLLPVGGRP